MMLKRKILTCVLLGTLSMSFVACGTQAQTSETAVLEELSDGENMAVAAEQVTDDDTKNVESEATGDDSADAVDPNTASGKEDDEAALEDSVENVEKDTKVVGGDVASNSEGEIDTEKAASDGTQQAGELETISPDTINYTYTDLNETKFAKSSVNVRDLPSTDGKKVGSLLANDEIQITGQCKETGWYRLAYNDGTAYVSNNYVVNEKIETTQETANTAEAGSQKVADQKSATEQATPKQTATEECPYPLYTVIDEGGDKVYYYFVKSIGGDITTSQGSLYWECATVIARRHGWVTYLDDHDNPNAGMGGGNEPVKTNYTYNGEVVYRQRPCTYLIGPEGGGPVNAIEVVNCP